MTAELDTRMTRWSALIEEYGSGRRLYAAYINGWLTPADELAVEYCCTPELVLAVQLSELWERYNDHRN